MRSRSRTQLHLKELFCLAHELFRDNGFRDVPIEARGHYLLKIALHSRGGYRHQRHLRKLRVATYLPGYLEAIELGHVQVAEDEIGFLASGKLQAFLAVHGLERRVPESVKEIRHEVEVFRVIIKDKYARCHSSPDVIRKFIEELADERT